MRPSTPCAEHDSYRFVVLFCANANFLSFNFLPLSTYYNNDWFWSAVSIPLILSSNLFYRFCSLSLFLLWSAALRWLLIPARVNHDNTTEIIRSVISQASPHQPLWKRWFQFMPTIRLCMGLGEVWDGCGMEIWLWTETNWKEGIFRYLCFKKSYYDTSCVHP